MFTITDEIDMRGFSEPADPSHVDLARGAITGIEQVAEPQRLGELDLEIFDA